MTEQKEMKLVEKIRDNYSQKPKELSKFEEIKLLDKKVKKPALVFAYVFGIIGTLVLGLGMCFAMKVLGDLFILGIVVGCVGILMVSINYPIYKAILNKRKAKYSEVILEKSNELLND